MRPRTRPDRLEAVAELVPGGTVVADVGTDHGRLPARLLAAGRVSRLIATERTERGLAPARERLASWRDDRRLSLRSGDGLEPLRPADGVRVLVISGMGARKMLALLERRDPRQLGIARLVLQPQSETARLRRWLGEHGWGIVDERLVEDGGRFYPVEAAEDGASPPWEAPAGLEAGDLDEAGPALVRSADPAVRRMWEARLASIDRALPRARTTAGRGRLERRRARARRILAALPRPGPAL